MRRCGLLLLLLLAFVVAGACGKESAPTPTPSEAAPVTTQSPTVATTTPEPPPPSVAAPVALEIPAIGVKSKVVPVGLNKNGSMQTPAYDVSQTGWYKLGPKPGAKGPAVIVGHVDSKRGPDVFAKLSQLKVGDKARVSDGNRWYTFVVGAREQVHKRALPYKKIWGPTPNATLRLVTCAGDYVSGAYEDNLVVYLNEVR